MLRQESWKFTESVAARGCRALSSHETQTVPRTVRESTQRPGGPEAARGREEALFWLSRCPGCPGVQAIPGVPRAPAVLVSRLSWCPGAPVSRLSRVSQLSRCPGCPGVQAVLVSWLSRLSRLSRCPGCPACPGCPGCPGAPVVPRVPAGPGPAPRRRRGPFKRGRGGGKVCRSCGAGRRRAGPARPWRPPAGSAAMDSLTALTGKGGRLLRGTASRLWSAVPGGLRHGRCQDGRSRGEPGPAKPTPGTAGQGAEGAGWPGDNGGQRAAWASRAAGLGPSPLRAFLE